MVTQDRLKDILLYDKDTGVFTWRIQRGQMKVGSVAGCIYDRGYIRIRIDGTRYLAHRLAWLYSTGSFPSNYMDHIDRDPSNNRLCNLRPATAKQNQGNRKINSNNKSGFKGVSWCKRKLNWAVFINLSGRHTRLGCYADKNEAAQAYRNAAIEEHGEYALNV